MTSKVETTEKRTKGILVRVLPSVYEECMRYNLNIPLIMRRGLTTELELHKIKMAGKSAHVMMSLYDDKTMSFKDGGVTVKKDNSASTGDEMKRELDSIEPTVTSRKRPAKKNTTGDE